MRAGRTACPGLVGHVTPPLTQGRGGQDPSPLLSTLRPPPLPAQRGHLGPPCRVPVALSPSRVALGATVLAGTC